jgi:hypothetical protein
MINGDLGPSLSLCWMGAEMEDFELLMHVLERNRPYDRALMSGDEMWLYRHEYDPG